MTETPINICSCAREDDKIPTGEVLSYNPTKRPERRSTRSPPDMNRKLLEKKTYKRTICKDNKLHRLSPAHPQ